MLYVIECYPYKSALRTSDQDHNSDLLSEFRCNFIQEQLQRLLELLLLQCA